MFSVSWNASVLHAFCLCYPCHTRNCNKQESRSSNSGDGVHLLVLKCWESLGASSPAIWKYVVCICLLRNAVCLHITQQGSIAVLLCFFSPSCEMSVSSWSSLTESSSYTGHTPDVWTFVFLIILVVCVLVPAMFWCRRRFFCFLPRFA